LNREQEAGTRGAKRSADAGADRNAAAERPRVIVDFEVEGDALLVAVRNIGNAPAAAVRVTFEPAFRGLGGSVDFGRLPLFHKLSFLAPGRSIRALVDPLDAFLSRTRPAEPRVIRVTVTCMDAAGRRYRAKIRHDLSIWENLPRLRSESAHGH
jgi:hypothetical protein